MAVKIPKKLIEVALPLDDINAAASREKSIRHGHPSTLHLWWARRPLAAARAVIFSQMVNDPGGERGYYAGKTKAQADAEREKLFDIIRDLVKWENTNNEEVLERAREEIRKSWQETCALNKGKEGFDPEKLPAFHDPFAGGGSLPLEAQRLGLESYASDLNPVAVMINKAMIEIPPKFAGREPVGPIPEADKHDKKRATKNAFEDWSGTNGLAEDVRRYGCWMREEAFKQIGHLYPQVEITEELAEDRGDLQGLVGEKFTVSAWLWARTVKSPNPAFSNVDVPLVKSFILSSKKNKEIYIEPVVKGGGVHFLVKHGKPENFSELKNGTKLSRGANFRCLVSNSPIEPKYIKSEGIAGRIGQKLIAIVAEGKKGKIYLSPTVMAESAAFKEKETWKPETKLPDDPRNFWTVSYGLNTFGDLFTSRQLIALTTFSDLVQRVKEKVIRDALKTGKLDDELSLNENGMQATAYGEAISVYLGLSLGRAADYWTSNATWEASGGFIAHAFTKQAIPMIWDFVEGNPFSSSGGNWEQTCLSWVVRVINNLSVGQHGKSLQFDAQKQTISNGKVISCDPPYYDNISYADLSDYFYVWMRRTFKDLFPELFMTIAVPKSEELISSPYRHGSKELAEQFFMNGMTCAIHNLSEQAHPAFPVTIYYAFKQSETKANGTVSKGWETFLEAIIKAGFEITGTWPIRTEREVRSIGLGTNALASSIILVCQKREQGAETPSRRQFQRELRADMPESLETMIGGDSGQSPIAPVDLAQAAIGPGMAIFSKYTAVLNQDGSNMSVHDALILINREITDYLNPDSGAFDSDTLFCSSWFDQYGWSTGIFGEADTLARAKGTTVDGVDQAGVIESGGGKVRLLKWAEYPADWSPEKDNRTPVWEATHQLIRALNQQGEADTGALLARMPERGESIRQLAYHLYTLCERKGWAEDARAYNELIGSWHAIVSASLDAGHRGEQGDIFS